MSVSCPSAKQDLPSNHSDLNTHSIRIHVLTVRVQAHEWEDVSGSSPARISGPRSGPLCP